MSNIIKRLRKAASLCHEAADKIERLQNDRDELLAALKQLSAFAESNMNDYPSEHEEQTYDIARAAIANAEAKP